MEPATDAQYGSGMLYAEWSADEKTPLFEVVSRFQTQDRAFDVSKKTPARLDAAMARKWTQPTDLMPADDTADEITRGKRSDLEKVQAIYDWILANTCRDPKVRGCGVGDIKAMLETKNFGGKCADLNGLSVGLSRAAGVPARDIYGIRVAPSAFGYKALGAGSANISKAQHCRAEAFLQDYGWVAMDPADVAKVARRSRSRTSADVSNRSLTTVAKSCSSIFGRHGASPVATRCPRCAGCGSGWRDSRSTCWP
jgi:transglutaminase-like putative cysteine protease